MSALHNIAIAGATGSLGSALTEELVKAGFKVTALTRDASKAKLPRGVSAVTVDYNSLDSVTKALQGQDALVSALGIDALGKQKILVDAVVAAGVKRFIPSDFGHDYETEESLALPVFADLIELQRYYTEKFAGTGATYTIVVNNAFLDWGIKANFWINVREKKANLYDGGDVRFTVTPLSLVGEGVAGVLKHPAETANRRVKIHGCTTTINQILDTIKEIDGVDGWELTPYDTVEETRKSLVAFQSNPYDAMAWATPQICRFTFGKGVDVDYADENDNAVLGISGITEAEFKDIVKKSLAEARSA